MCVCMCMCICVCIDVEMTDACWQQEARPSCLQPWWRPCMCVCVCMCMCMCDYVCVYTMPATGGEALLFTAMVAPVYVCMCVYVYVYV